MALGLGRLSRTCQRSIRLGIRKNGLSKVTTAPILLDGGHIASSPVNNAQASFGAFTRVTLSERAVRYHRRGIDGLI